MGHSSKEIEIFYKSFFLCIVALFFFGTFFIKQSFIPLIFLGSVSAVLFFFFFQEKNKIFPVGKAVSFFLVFCAWVCISSFWGVESNLQFLTALRFFSNFFLAWFAFILIPFLSKRQIDTLKKIFLLAFIGIVFIGSLEITWCWIKFGSTRPCAFRRNIILVLGLLWPVLFLVSKEKSKGKRYFFLAALLLPVTFLSFCGPMSAAAIAYAIGIVAFIIISYHWFFCNILLLAFIIIFCLFIPLILFVGGADLILENFHQYLAPSWSHRILIWSTAVNKFSLSPLIGWGVDATRHLEAKMIVNESFIHGGPLVDQFSPIDVLPVHVHQGWLQILLELGVVGGILFVGFLFQGVREVKSCCKEKSSWVFASFFTLLVPFSVSFGVWQTSWISIWLYTFLFWRLIFVGEKKNI